MFEPRTVTLQHPLTGEDYEAHEYPSCHLCARVLTEDDHGDDAGTDGEIFWCSHLHSPDGLAEIEAFIAFEADREERVKEESLLRLKATIDEAVRDALMERGLA